MKYSNNSYLNDRLAIDRLKEEYKKHSNLIIGIDFDNTIFDYHNKGLDLQPVIDLIKRCNNLKFPICLYTATLSKSGKEHRSQIVEKSGYIKYHFRININYINDSPVSRYTVDDDIKPFFNILLDDRAGLSASYNILKTALDELNL